MKGLRIGKVFGIEIDIHWSTLLIVALVMQGVYQSFVPIRHPDCNWAVNLVLSGLMAVGLLGSILLHELAHARVGQHYGIGFSGITLFALGGMAKMDSRIPNAKAEGVMAFAGPLMSLVLGIVCVALYLPDAHKVSQLGLYGYFATVMKYTGIINIILAVFNMIPANPLDGGRVLRAIIWGATKNYRIATLICANIGRGFAGLFAACGVAMCLGVYIPFFGTGLFGGLWLAFIAFFLYGAANAELQSVK
jgi:Zn-dependent protease